MFTFFYLNQLRLIQIAQFQPNRCRNLFFKLKYNPVIVFCI